MNPPAAGAHAPDRWIEVNGVSLRFRLSGTGPRTLVLVHEMGGTLESWDALLAWLQQAAGAAAGEAQAALSDYRMLRYDLRGSGMSEKLRGPLAEPTLHDMTQDLAQLLDALEIDGPVALAGCAVGARIALSFAAHAPTRVAALVALAPSLDVGTARAQAARDSIARIEREGTRAAMRESLQRMFAAPLGMDVRIGADYLLRHAGNDASSYAAIYRMLLASRLDGQLGAIRCACLILAGDLDTARPMEEIAAAAATIPGARFETLHSGHFMHLQTPHTVGARMLQFLHDVQAAARA